MRSKSRDKSRGKPKKNSASSGLLAKARLPKTTRAETTSQADTATPSNDSIKNNSKSLALPFKSVRKGASGFAGAIKHDATSASRRATRVRQARTSVSPTRKEPMEKEEPPSTDDLSHGDENKDVPNEDAVSTFPATLADEELERDAADILKEESINEDFKSKASAKGHHTVTASIFSDVASRVMVNEAVIRYVEMSFGGKRMESNVSRGEPTNLAREVEKVVAAEETTIASTTLASIAAPSVAPSVSSSSSSNHNSHISHSSHTKAVGGKQTVSAMSEAGQAMIDFVVGSSHSSHSMDLSKVTVAKNDGSTF